MTETETLDIVKKIKRAFDKMTAYSEGAQSGPFLSYYDNSPTFLHFGGDGKMRNYEEFKQTCTEYYTTLKEQKIITTHEKIHVIGKNLAILGWTGNIIAQFKNGDIMKMNNYSFTSVFRNIDSNWKVIHTHESSLPPEISKKE